MKTEQEQINKLANTIFEIINRENIDRFTEDKNGNLVCVETVGIEGIAETLIKAGYGDVSEYKAEIERLKLENERFENNMKAVLEIEKKQAQIDVLNNVKDITANQIHHCLEMHDWAGQSAISECEKWIDKLIKEVQGK